MFTSIIKEWIRCASQVRRGSLLSQPRSVLQKLASISEGNPLAPRNTRGFLFQALSPQKDAASSDVPQKQVREPLCSGAGRQETSSFTVMNLKSIFKAILALLKCWYSLIIYSLLLSDVKRTEMNWRAAILVWLFGVFYIYATRWSQSPLLGKSHEANCEITVARMISNCMKF